MEDTTRLDPIMLDIAETLGACWVKDIEASVIRVSVGDYLLEAEPFTRNDLFGIDCAISHPKFGELVNSISGDKPSSFVCIKWFQLTQTGDATSTAFTNLVRDAVYAVSALQLTDLLRDFLSPPHGKPTTPQLCHLAAIAWSGRFVEIMEYRDALAGFGYNPLVPMITGSMLDRAFDEAVARSE